MNASASAFKPTARAHLPQTRRGRALRDALPLLAMFVARQCGVEVIFGDWHPHRIGKKIYLPNLPFDDPNVEVLALGFLLHEIAHVRSDKGEPCVTTSALQDGIRNLLQDAVDERFLGRDYPGFKVRLHQMVQKLVQSGDFAPASDDDPPLVKLRKYLLYRLRAVLVGQSALSDYAAQAESLVRQAFPAGACVRIGSVLGRVASMRTRQEVADLAQEIVEIVQEESEEPPPEGGGGDDGGDDDAAGSDNGATPSSSAGDSAGDASRSANVPPSDATTSDASQAIGGQVPDPASAARQRANLRSLLDATAGDFGPDLTKVLSDALNDQAAEALAEGMGGGVGLASAPITKPNVDPATVLAEVAQTTIALRTRLSALVEASREEEGGYRRHGTRVDPRRFVAAMCGDPRIYRNRVEERDVNTRVIWLIDRSISMKINDRIKIARQSVLAAAATLETIPGMSQAVAAFPGYQSEVTVITGFHQTVRRTAPFYHGITPSGGTPALQALLWGVDQLLAGSEPRKFLIMLTDGEPEAKESCKELIRRCWDSGIEACAIGIRCADISDLFPVSRLVDELQDLAPAIFDLLQELLTRKAFA